MPLTARDLYFAVRVDDRATRPLRRIAGEIRAMRRFTGGDELRSRQLALQQAQLVARQARDTRQLTLNQQAALQEEKLRVSQMSRQVQLARAAGIARREALINERLITRELAVQIAEARERESALAVRREPLERMQSRVDVARAAGRGLRTVGLVGTAAMGFAAYKAAQFQTESTLAATQARPAGANALATLRIQKQVSDAVLKQMQQFPSTAKEMNDAFYQIFGSTNIQSVDKASRLLKVFNQEAVAGQAPLDAMVQAGITLGNNFPEFFNNPRKAANRFFAAVRYGRMNVEQFARSLPNIIPIARRVGLGFNDVADAAAELTRQTGASFTSRDMQGLAQLIQILARPEIRKGFKAKYNIDVTDAKGNMRSLVPLMEEIAAKTKGLGKVDQLNLLKEVSKAGGSPQGIRGNIQANRALAYLLDNIKEYHNVARLVNRDNNEFARSFEALSRSPGVRWQIFTNQLRALVIIIGTAALPIFLSLGQHIERVAKWFERLSPHWQRMIGYALAFGSLGALVGGVLIGIVGGLASLVIGLRLATIGFGGLGAEAGIIGARFAIFMGIAGGLILILIRFPGIFHSITNAVGGTKNMIELLGLAIAALTFAKIITGIAAIGSEAAIAGGEVGALRGMLLGLNGLRVTAFIVLSTIGVKGLIDWGKHSERTTGLNPLQRLANTVYKHAGPLKFMINHYTPDMTKIEPSRRGALNAPVTLGQAPINQAVWDAAQGAWVHAGSHLPLTIGQQKQAEAAWKALNLRGNKPHAGSVADIAFVRNMPSARSLNQQGMPAQADNVAAATANVKQLKAAYAEAEKAALRANPLHPKEYAAAQTKAANLYAKLQDAIGKRDARIQKKTWDAQISAMNRAQRHADALAKKQQRAAEAAAKKQANLENRMQKQAADNLVNFQQQALQTLTQKWKEFYQANQQAAGQLFQGPFMQLIGNPFEGLGQFGVRTPISLLSRDLKTQVDMFARFRTDLDIARKRKFPKELVSELQAAGPEALPNIDTIVRAQGPAFRQYMSYWRRQQRLINTATKQDFKPVLNTWRQHGKEIMKALQQGMEDEDFTLFRTLKRSILADLRGTKAPTGHGRHGTTVNTTTNNGPDLHFHVSGSITDVELHNNAIKQGLWWLKQHKKP